MKRHLKNGDMLQDILFPDNIYLIISKLDNGAYIFMCCLTQLGYVGCSYFEEKYKTNFRYKKIG